MSDWHDVAKVSDFIEQDCIKAMIGNRSIVVIKHENEYFALDNACSHAGAPLEHGVVNEGNIMCPFHGARFCLKTGKALCPPAFNSIATYPTRVENSKIQVYT